jgi:DNA-binding HxlR family transcriptional regulator
MNWLADTLPYLLVPPAIVLLVFALVKYYKRRDLAYKRETLDAFLVVSHLLAKPSQNIVDIQKAMGLNYSRLNSMLRRLERLGIVEATLRPTPTSNYETKVAYYRVTNRILARDLKAFAKEYDSRSHHEK